MAKTEYFVQAYMKRETETGIERTVSWVPEHLAIAGQVISLKRDDGTWTKKYLVTGKGDQRLTRKVMMQVSHGHDKFKENTDI